MPGDFRDELRAKGVHDKVMIYLGTMTDRQGWCWAEQIEIARKYGLRKETVSRAIRDLCSWGWLDRNTVFENKKKRFFYRIKMDRDVSRDDLVQAIQDAQKAVDLQINRGGQLIYRSTASCSTDQLPVDLQVNSYNKDERPPLTTPSLDLREGEGFENIFDDLSQNENHARVVKHFLRPMLVALAPEKHHTADFFKMLCDRLGEYSDGALNSAANGLIVSRVKFPSIKICNEECAKKQPDFLITVRRHDEPAAWAAWVSEYSRRGQKWQVSQMANGHVDFIRVATLYPPVLKPETAGKAGTA